MTGIFCPYISLCPWVMGSLIALQVHSHRRSQIMGWTWSPSSRKRQKSVMYLCFGIELYLASPDAGMRVHRLWYM